MSGALPLGVIYPDQHKGKTEAGYLRAKDHAVLAKGGRSRGDRETGLKGNAFEKAEQHRPKDAFVVPEPRLDAVQGVSLFLGVGEATFRISRPGDGTI